MVAAAAAARGGGNIGLLRSVREELGAGVGRGGEGTRGESRMKASSNDEVRASIMAHQSQAWPLHLVSLSREPHTVSSTPPESIMARQPAQIHLTHSQPAMLSTALSISSPVVWCSGVRGDESRVGSGACDGWPDAVAGQHGSASCNPVGDGAVMATGHAKKKCLASERTDETRPVNPSVSQPVNQPINRQSASQPASQSISQPIAISQSVSSPTRSAMHLSLPACSSRRHLHALPAPSIGCWDQLSGFCIHPSLLVRRARRHLEFHTIRIAK